MKKKVLLLSEAFGSGHIKAAEALAQGISLQDPSVETQIIEIGRMYHPIISGLILGSYKQIITNIPFLWKKIYHHLSEPNQTTPYWLQFIIYQLLYRNIEQVLSQVKPDLVICMHSFSSSSLSRLKKMGHPVSLCTVITDFHAHQVWAQPEVDLYHVSHDEVLQQLVHFGIPKHRIVVTGIPIKSNFWIKNNKLEARTKLNLKDMPTVMVMGGGLGLGGIKELAHSLVKWKENVQLIICTGYNHTLRISLERNKQFQHPHIVIMGFVDIIDQLLDASDLLITKPGGLTCSEALSKGIPMLIYQPIPGHEEYNCSYLVRHDLAVKIHSRQQVDEWIKKLLFSPETFEGLYENIKQFQQKVNPLAGARAVLDLLAR